MNDAFSTKVWPTDIHLHKAERILEVSFEDGSRFRLPAEYLRVESPSAEVQGHAPGQKVTIPGRMHVGIIAIETVGNYAVRLTFDDLHDTGIYTWQYLHELGTEQETRWAKYLAEVERQGLSRDPRKVG